MTLQELLPRRARQVGHDQRQGEYRDGAEHGMFDAARIGAQDGAPWGAPIAQATVRTCATCHSPQAQVSIELTVVVVSRVSSRHISPEGHPALRVHEQARGVSRALRAASIMKVPGWVLRCERACWSASALLGW